MIEPICTIEVKGKKLHVFYNKQYRGLYSFFSSDGRVEEYINNNIENAFFEAINTEEDGTYSLNIASILNFGAFEWKNAGDILHRQLNIFMPIIQKFVEEAVAERLE